MISSSILLIKSIVTSEHTIVLAFHAIALLQKDAGYAFKRLKTPNMKR